MHKQIKFTAAKILIAATSFTGVAQGADWSSTFVGYRYGEQFREPNNRHHITKHILQLGHSSGYSLGQNFVNLDILQSDQNDPARYSSSGATEFYLTYRHQLHFSKVFDRDFSWGPVKDVALTAGFEFNRKNSIVAPRKRMFVLGPTLKLDVPGFLDLSLLAAQESNHNQLGKITHNRNFDTQLMFNASWGIPFQVGSVPMKFQGFLNHLSEKGKDYNGVDTAPETLMRTSLMLDMGHILYNRKKQFYAGVGYEYWHNKFGYRDRSATDNRKKEGILTRTPTFQAEFYF